MPTKHSVKQYETNAYYHLFNRGTRKQKIYLDDQDYSVFLSYLKNYLSPPPPANITIPPPRVKNYNLEIKLLSYCLMPNHFHLLIKQSTRRGIAKFIQSLSTRYSVYFNKKYQLSGSLFQGTYRAVKITSEEQLLHLTRYIHQNPKELTKNIEDYPYSSLKNYLGQIKQAWVKPNEILSYFSQTIPNLTYRSFVKELELDNNLINKLTLD